MFEQSMGGGQKESNPFGNWRKGDFGEAPQSSSKKTRNSPRQEQDPRGGGQPQYQEPQPEPYQQHKGQLAPPQK